MIRLAIFMQNPRYGYSGGRYHALILAEAFSARGNMVTIFSNVETEVFDDLSNLPGHDRINFIVSKKFAFQHYLSSVDIVVIIPSMAKDENLYSQAALCAANHNAKLVLLNFESPNWFNSLSPVERDPHLWDLWQKYSRYCSVVLCSAKESVRYAKEYYEVDDSQTIFKSCPPSINNFADRTGDKYAPEDRILIFARFTWAEQKGCTDLRKFIRSELKGYTLVVITGMGGFPEDKRQEVLLLAEKHGMNIDFFESLNEQEKAIQIKKARLILFPSYFEGFGYPPVEAFYYKTPCVAFELPVLKEFTQPYTFWVPTGDWEKFFQTIVEALDRGSKYGAFVHAWRKRYFSLKAFGKRLDLIFREAMKLPENSELKKLRTIEKQEWRDPMN